MRIKIKRLTMNRNLMKIKIRTRRKPMIQTQMTIKQIRLTDRIKHQLMTRIKIRINPIRIKQITTIRISPVTGPITTDSKITALIMIPIPVQTAQINLTAVKRTKPRLIFKYQRAVQFVNHPVKFRSLADEILHLKQVKDFFIQKPPYEKRRF